MKHTSLLVLVSLFTVSTVAALHTGTVSAQQTAAPATWNGVYSTAQAQRGAPLYAEMCAGCHGPALAGDALAPALTGPAFLGRWQARPLGDLLETLHNTMPQNSPGGMSRQQSADVLAFVVSKSGAAAGSREIAPGGEPTKAASVPPGPAVPPGFYTEHQARRGHVLFGKVCTPCHTATPDFPASSLAGRGFSLGSQKIFIDLGGRALQKYPSVYHVYRRIRDSMPSYDATSVSPIDKVDIMAYLLKANGFPAGNVPLPPDPTSMKVLKIGASERGFVPVFNGRDFAGVRFLLGPNCRPAPTGCGKTEPGSIFTVADGAIVTTGKVQGYWYPDQKYKNFTLRFDYTFDRPADLDPGDEFYEGNSGYLVFITEHRVWPKGIEIQGNSNNMLHSFGMDAKVVAKDFPDARARAFRPIGQWNSVEIVAKDGQIKSYHNGELLSHVTEHEFTEAGYIGFQSEGVPLRWRNIRIKPE
jgi:mono/diheme cytochrome c family protein